MNENKLNLRLAKTGDVKSIRELLADDKLGQTREDMSDNALPKYIKAFQAIQTSPDNQLWVAELNGKVVGTWQVTYIPYLSRAGNTRCLIEAVRTASSYRGQGIGKQMMEFAIEQARARGCLLVQLTTDKTRPQAHNFYQGLGFSASHEGMKLRL